MLFYQGFICSFGADVHMSKIRVILSLKRSVLQAFFSTVCLITLLYGSSYAQITGRGGGETGGKTPPDTVLTADSLNIPKEPLSAKPKRFLESVVKYSAKDSIIMAAGKRRIYLYGNAVLDYTTINLKAAYVEIDMDKKTLSAKGIYDSLEGIWIGKPEFTDKDKTFTAEEMSYNFETKKGVVKSVITQEGEGFLHGDRVKYTRERVNKDTVQVIYVKGGRYTTCNLEQPHFHISANKIKVIPNDKIVTGPANFVIERVPTPIFLPFGFFPTKTEKASGIIFPQYGIQPSFGFFLREGGFYWAASPKVDLAITGSVYTNGSYGAGIRSNYKVRYKVSGNIAINFASSVFGSDPKLPDYRRQSEWRVNWLHNQDPKWLPGLSFKADVNVVTNGFNKFNQVNVTQFVQNTFQSNISLSYAIPRTPFNISANLRHEQNTSTRLVNLTLPEIVLSTARFFPFKNRKRGTPAKWWQQIWEGIGITHRTDFGNRIVTTDSTFGQEIKTLFRGRVINGMKHSFQANNSFKILKYINFNPSFNYVEYWNFKNQEKRWDNTTQQAVTDTLRGFFTDREWDVRADISTTIFGFFTFKKGKVKALRHVMTPSIFFSYNPNFNRAEYGYFATDGAFGSYLRADRQIALYGGPTRGPAGLIGFSLNNNLEMKVASAKDTLTGEKKIKLFEYLNITGSYNLIADSLRLQPFNISFRNSFFDNKLSVVFNSTLDPYALSIDSTGRGTRINKFLIKENGQLLRFTNITLNVTLALIGKPREPVVVNDNLTTAEEKQMVMMNRGDYLDFNIPYNLSLGYTFSYINPQNERTIVNNIQMRGDFSITKNWKIDFTTGFDIVNKKFTPTSIGINRNLHCWQMDFQWIPFGTIASYVFTIRAKSSLLQDLKLNRRRDWAPSL